MPATIRVLVVDDSALIRQMLTRALSMDPRIEVIGTAKTGIEAVEKSRELHPDVVTLDIEMPELSGLEALPHLRKHSDARVVMLSSLDDPDTTYRALSLGAVDFLTKPQAGVASSITELTDMLLKKIKTAYRITPAQAAAVFDAVQAQRAGDPTPSGVADTVVPDRMAGVPATVCVAIASSTGGPPVLERVFSGLSRSLDAAFILVQHLPPGFSSSLARRLSTVGDIPVVEAARGQVLERGCAYIAPYGRHVVVRRDGVVGTLDFTEEAPRHGVRPAADPLLESVAEHFGSDGVAVVLTGMGSDGAEGALAVRLAGGDVVVQNEESSVVWGMPGAALRRGATHRVTPVGLIAAEIRRAIRMRTERGCA